VRLFIPGALRISYGHRRLALVHRRHARDGRERMMLLRKDGFGQMARPSRKLAWFCSATPPLTL
jgi:hypothetical protein